jgi:hypothetical protein
MRRGLPVLGDEKQPGSHRNMVRPERFELPTYCSGGNRSIQSELRAHCANYTIPFDSASYHSLARIPAETTCT